MKSECAGNKDRVAAFVSTSQKAEASQLRTQLVTLPHKKGPVSMEKNRQSHAALTDVEWLIEKRWDFIDGLEKIGSMRCKKGVQLEKLGHRNE